MSTKKILQLHNPHQQTGGYHYSLTAVLVSSFLFHKIKGVSKMANDALLLNYMYQKGYTEEGMYDIATMSKVERSFEYCLHRFKLGAVKIVGALKVFADKVVEVWSGVADQIREIWPVIKEVTSREPVLSRYKTYAPIDFTKRHQSRHQVLNRKPPHQIRKILR